MSQVTLSILDSRRAIHGQPHYGFAEAVIASLSADPETIEELEAAVARFEAPRDERGCFSSWSSGVDDQPYDGGVCIIDLAARLVACQTTCFYVQRHGEVRYHNGQHATDQWLPFTLADDWKLIHDVDQWEWQARDRRSEGVGKARIDFRAVLFGPPLIDYLVQECQSFQLGAAATDSSDPIVEIHARWLQEPREELCGRSPRDWLLADKDHINVDLQWRDQQWSMQGCCPPPLSRHSAAYRYGGCGTHEIVLYYDLVRYLLTEAFEWRHKPDSISAGDFAACLTRLRDQWLDSPQNERLHGKSPRQVIDDERRRIPQAITGEQAMLHPDCPICAMLAEMSGPLFWHLDGCHMENQFAFSFCRTREQWEREQLEWAEFYQRDDLPGPPASVWQRSFSSPNLTHDMPPRMAAEVLLLSIGGHLGELIEDCLELAESDQWRERLQRDFGNLTASAGDPGDAVVSGVVMKFQNTLADLADCHPSLAAKCDDLSEKLGDFAARLAVPRT